MEKLGFLEGSLSKLTDSITNNIKKHKSEILTNSLIENIIFNKDTKKYELFIEENGLRRNIYTDKIIFTTSSKVANISPKLTLVLTTPNSNIC